MNTRRGGPEYHSADGTCHILCTDEGWHVVWKGVLIEVKATRKLARELIRALKHDGLGDVAQVLSE